MSFWGWESAKKAGKIHLYLEVAGIIFLTLLVFCEALEEQNTTLSQAFKRAGTCSLAALVMAEVARLLYGHRADKLSESEHIRLKSEVRSLRTESNETSRLLADRTLGDVIEFEQDMRAFAGTKVYVRTLKEHASDPESGELVSSLKHSLGDAGWQVADPLKDRVLSPLTVQEGVHIEYSAIDWYWDSPASHVIAGCALADWLNKDNIATAINAVPNRRKNAAVIINVGPKPSTLGMMNELKYRGDWRLRARPQAYRPITQKDAELIRALLEQAGGDREHRFLRFMDVAHIEDIRQGDLRAALDQLRAVIRYKRSSP